MVKIRESDVHYNNGTILPLHELANFVVTRVGKFILHDLDDFAFTRFRKIDVTQFGQF